MPDPRTATSCCQVRLRRKADVVRVCDDACIGWDRDSRRMRFVGGMRFRLKSRGAAHGRRRSDRHSCVGNRKLIAGSGSPAQGDADGEPWRNRYAGRSAWECKPRCEREDFATQVLGRIARRGTVWVGRVAIRRRVLWWKLSGHDVGHHAGRQADHAGGQQLARSPELRKFFSLQLIQRAAMSR